MSDKFTTIQFKTRIADSQNEIGDIELAQGEPLFDNRDNTGLYIGTGTDGETGKTQFYPSTYIDGLMTGSSSQDGVNVISNISKDIDNNKLSPNYVTIKNGSNIDMAPNGSSITYSLSNTPNVSTLGLGATEGQNAGVQLEYDSDLNAVKFRFF